MSQDHGREFIDEIQVTATRRPVAIGSVSNALSVINAEKIANGQLSTDALAAVPGVFLQQTTPGQGAAIVRGLKGSEVLHLVDGMRLNNAIFRNAPTQYLALVAPGTLERIEIVRGAPASLYGSDAVGGVVQAISRMPSLDASGSAFDARIAFDTADLAKSLQASAEFGDETVAALVSGEYLDTGNRRIGGGARIVPSGYASKGGRIAVALTAEGGQSWLLDLQMARQPMTPRVDELVPGYGQAEPSSAEFFFAPNERVFAHVRHSRDPWIGGATWHFDVAWQRIVDDRISRNYQSDSRHYENNRSDLYGLTINATGESENGSWIAGAEFYHDLVSSTRIEEDLVAGSRLPVAARFPDGSTVDQAAIFGNALRDLGARHKLSAGLRWSAITSELPAVGDNPASQVDQDDVSADLGWLFELTETTQVTANLGYGFRAPNVFDLGTFGERPGNRFNIPNPDLASEHITQFDIGLRRHGDRLSVEVTAFTLHYADRIASVLTGDVTADGRDVTQSRNVESADIRGLEFGGQLLIAPSIFMDLVLNITRGEQADVDGTLAAGDRIPPLNGQLSVEFAGSDALTVTPYLQFASRQDRLSPRDVQDSRINPAGTPGWLNDELLDKGFAMPTASMQQAAF